MAIRKEERIGGQRLILGDCLEVMPLLGEVDAVVTDPPYGIGEAKGKSAGFGVRQDGGWTSGDNKTRSNLAAAKDYGRRDWDEAPATAAHMEMIRAISKAQIIFGGNYFEGLGPTSCWLVWDKQNGDNDFADCELAWTNLPKAVRRIYWRWNGMIRKGDDVREHPTQKPVGVIKWCIKHLPDNAQTILDPFMGSGTTLVACQKLGRHGIGIELDPDYFEIACKRVDEATRQPDLFVEPVKAPVQEGFDL